MKKCRINMAKKIHQQSISNIIYSKENKTRQGSPVDCRPSPDEAPPIGKIHPFSKIAVTLEPLLQFGCPSRFRVS